MKFISLARRQTVVIYFQVCDKDLERIRIKQSEMISI